MVFDDYYKKAKAISANTKGYIFGLLADDGKHYHIESSDNDPQSFGKLVFNLIIQESFKHLQDDTFILPDIIMNMISKNIDGVPHFATEPFDYDSLKLAPESVTNLPNNLLLGRHIDKDAAKLARKLDEITGHGKQGNYMLFYDIDDQIFSLKDNEERDLVLVFTYFIDGCRKYRLKPHRMMRAIKKQASELRTALLGKSKLENTQSKSSQLLFYEIASGGRYDFDRDVKEFEAGKQIRSVLLKNFTYYYRFGVFMASTNSTIYVISTQNSSQDTIAYIKDIVPDFVRMIADNENKNYEEVYNGFISYAKMQGEKVKDDISGYFSITDDKWLSEDVPAFDIKHKCYPDANSNFDFYHSLGALVTDHVLAGYFYLWHSNDDAGINGGGSILHERNDYDSYFGMITLTFGYLSLIHPEIKERLISWYQLFN